MNRRVMTGILAGIVFLFLGYLVTVKTKGYLFSRKATELERQGSLLYKRGSSLAVKGQMEEAIEKYKEVVLKFPDTKKAEESYLALAGLYQKKGKLLEAKNTYQMLLKKFPHSRFIGEVQEKLQELNMKLLFSPQLTANSQLYQVKSGDTLGKIASQFNTTVDLIMKSNNLETDMIRPGKRLKIWRGKFSVVIDKSQNILILKSDEEVMKTYPVSTGKDNFTPLGTFKIASKLINPPWKGIPPEDPRNILGSRWLGFAEPFRNYGIHGTTDPESIGKHVTEGCIRMLNQDVEELYTILPFGTEVTIIE